MMLDRYDYEIEDVILPDEKNELLELKKELEKFKLQDKIIKEELERIDDRNDYKLTLFKTRFKLRMENVFKNE